MEHHGNGACFLDCTWSPRKDVAGGRVDTDGSARESHDSDGYMGNGGWSSSGCGSDSTISRPSIMASLSSRSSGKPYPPAAGPRPSFFSALAGELAAAGSSSAVSLVLETCFLRADEPWQRSSFDLSRTRSSPRWLVFGCTAACPPRRL